MKNILMIQSQLLILLITFLLLLLKLFTQKSNFQINHSKIFCHEKSMIFFSNREEIYEIISSLSTNKSCGSNSIPTKVLHLLQDQMSNHLSTSCNLSFSTGDFLLFSGQLKLFPFTRKIPN